MNADIALSQDQKITVPVNSTSKRLKSGAAVNYLCMEDMLQRDETNFLATFISIATSQNLPKLNQQMLASSSDTGRLEKKAFIGQFSPLPGIDSVSEPLFTREATCLLGSPATQLAENSALLGGEDSPSLEMVNQGLSEKKTPGAFALCPDPGNSLSTPNQSVETPHSSGSVQKEAKPANSEGPRLPLGDDGFNKTTPPHQDLWQASKVSRQSSELFSMWAKSTKEGKTADFAESYSFSDEAPVSQELGYPKPPELSKDTGVTATYRLVPKDSAQGEESVKVLGNISECLSTDFTVKTAMGEQKVMLKTVKGLAIDSQGFEEDSLDKRVAKSGAENSQNGLWLPANLAERLPEATFAAKETQPPHTPLETAVLKQIVEKAVLNFGNGQTSIKLKLKPEFLGPLRMHILTENHQVMVRILTDVPWVKETIEQNIDQLKAALQNHGLQIDKFDVSVASDAHSHNSHGGEHGIPSSVNLGGNADGEDATGGLSEELAGIGWYIESTNELSVINYFI